MKKKLTGNSISIKLFKHIKDTDEIKNKANAMRFDVEDLDLKLFSFQKKHITTFEIGNWAKLNGKISKLLHTLKLFRPVKIKKTSQLFSEPLRRSEPSVAIAHDKKFEKEPSMHVKVERLEEFVKERGGFASGHYSVNNLPRHSCSNTLVFMPLQRYLQRYSCSNTRMLYNDTRHYYYNKQ
ncbi:hypothetical protein WUBG_07296 [Wuchereria bancrofti]|nr:hypothetical protein WUBG_07296 [Wuchereria bancrofti]